MSFQRALKRGNAQAASTYLGMEGELFLDTQNQLVYVHDGVTRGGHKTFLSPGEIETILTTSLAGMFTPELKSKLAGIDALATKNANDAFLLDRTKHQGKQNVDTLSGLGSMAFVDSRNFPFFNLMADSGRFGGRTDPMSRLTGDFNNIGFMNGYNGVTFSSGGKFINDNTTYGGTRGVINDDVVELLQTMGREELRYGAEFHLVRAVRSGQTPIYPAQALNGVTTDLFSTTNMRCIFGAGNTTTFMAWVKVKQGTVCFRHGECYYDDVAVAPLTPIPPGWHHIRRHWVDSVGYDNGSPQIGMSLTGEVLMALPAFYNGRVSLGKHARPLIGFNENIS